ncbi:MAG: hypothetical protein Unbinned15contig1001_14 [Prokaryotic dsDNA virus sp.]|nr:MAG: hypothetical protein Unbinned15contig1001_14 [Prokaryotic dsDNA virus sp.]|tara:strand:- start:21324 stop:21545 length:222 start_codon:yes stop_codon:yes gene_type:complete
MALEISYNEKEDKYNISGLNYSPEEAETIARFIESNEFDKYVKNNPEYLKEIIPNPLDDDGFLQLKEKKNDDN